MALYEITKTHTMRAYVTNRTLAVAEAFGISLEHEGILRNRLEQLKLELYEFQCDHALFL